MTYLVERRGNYDDPKTCSKFSANSYVGYVTETCINVKDPSSSLSSFKIRCNVDSTATITKYSDNGCLANKFVSTNTVATTCSSSSATRFTYKCVNHWDDAFPNDEEIMAHKFYTDSGCDTFVGFSAIKTDTCVSSSGSAIYADFPKVKTYRKTSSSSGGSYCVASNFASEFTIGRSCDCHYTKIPSMTGSIFGTESTAFCGYAVKQTNISGVGGTSIPTIVGIVVGILALPLLYGLLYLTRGCVDKRIYAVGTRSIFSRRLGQVVPVDDDDHLAQPQPLTPGGNGVGGPPSPVIQFALVEEESPVVAQAVVVTNPSPVRNRQFPAATPIPTFTPTEVQMFTDVP